MDQYLPEVSVGTVVKRISKYYVKFIQSKTPYSKARIMFLWGPPGIGKTQSIEQIAEKVQEETGKRVVVTSIRLANFTRPDLVGFMIYDKEKKQAIWLPPEIFVLEDEPDTVNLVFLDEIPDAHEQLQKAVNQIVDERTVGVHKLAKNSLFILAGNRLTDNCMTYRMADSLGNRLRHYNVKPNFESWKEWAINHNIHEHVLGYLSYDNSKLYDVKKERDRVAFASPRSWEAVSNHLHIMEGEMMEELYTDICGDISMGTAMEFLNWCKVHNQLPAVEDIFKGTTKKYPKTMDALYALVSSMTVYVSQRKGKITDRELENGCRYASCFPMDFAAVFFNNIREIKGMDAKLLRSDSFVRWLDKNKHFV